MANPDRGAYDSDQLHDFDALEMEDDSEKSRLPLLVLIALVVLVAFGGVVWLAYTQGVERGRADAPRVIVAQARPAAHKVAQSQSPYAGLNIYQSSTPAPADSGNSDTVPPPPTPLAAARPANAPPALRPSAVSKQEPPLPKPTVQALRSVQAPGGPGAQQAVAPAPEGTESGQVPAPVRPKVTPETSNPSPTTKSGGVLLQIGSYKSESEAMHSWSAFRTRHAVAAGYSSDIQKVDLGAKGTWYRLRLGGLTDRKSAIALCEKLRAQGASCLLAR